MLQSLRESARHTSIVLGLSAIIGVSFGLFYGDGWSNFEAYVISGLRLFNPDLLAADWWATQTVHHHKNYAYVVAALRYFNILPWGLAVINLAAITAFGWMLFVIINALIGTRAIWAWLLVMFLFFVYYGTESVAYSYLFGPGAQPTTISAAFLMGAMTAFFLGRHVSSGLLLAAAGIFHTNFLILGFLFFGAAHLLAAWPLKFTDWRILIVQWAWQFAPALIVLAFELPHILNIVGLDLSPQERAEAGRILADFAGPQHYNISIFDRRFASLGGWVLMGVALLPNLSAEANAKRRFGHLFASGLILLAIATVSITAVNVESVSRLFIWRLAPYVLMMAQAIVVISVLHPFFHPSPRSAPRQWQMGLAAAGFALVLYPEIQKLFIFYPSIQKLLVALSLPPLLVVCGGAITLWALQAWAAKTNALHAVFMQWHRAALPLAVLAVLGLAANGAYSADPRKFNLVCSSCGKRSTDGLFSWARGVEPGSIFLIPPSMSAFRLVAERAVVVDLSGIPFRPDELIEWYHRMEAVSGGKGSLKGISYQDAFNNGGYKSLTSQTLDTLVQTYGVDYMVFPRDSAAASLAKDIVYRDEHYVVFRP